MASKKKIQHFFILYLLSFASLLISIFIFIQLLHTKNYLLQQVTKIQYQQKLIQKQIGMDPLEMEKLYENMEILNEKMNALAELENNKEIAPLEKE